MTALNILLCIVATGLKLLKLNIKLHCTSFRILINSQSSHISYLEVRALIGKEQRFELGWRHIVGSLKNDCLEPQVTLSLPCH